MAETVFETVNFEADKIEQRKKAKHKQKFDLDEKGTTRYITSSQLLHVTELTFILNSRVRLHSARVHKETGRPVDFELANALREAVSQPNWTPPRLCQARDGVHGPGGGGQSRSGAGEEWELHHHPDAGREDRVNVSGECRESSSCVHTMCMKLPHAQNTQCPVNFKANVNSLKCVIDLR